MKNYKITGLIIMVFTLAFIGTVYAAKSFSVNNSFSMDCTANEQANGIEISCAGILPVSPILTPTPTMTDVPNTPTPTSTIIPTVTPTVQPTLTPIPLPTTPPSGTRPRASINNNTMLTGDTHALLRGETPRIDDNDWSSQAYWDKLRSYHLNTIRILVYREPLNYPGGCGFNCNLASVQSNATDLNQWITAAEAQGFYAIVDYHGVGGRNTTQASDWWEVIAPMFADRTNVIYELTNEPGGANQYLAQYEETIRQVIRAGAPDTPLIFWSMENIYENNINAMISTTPQYILADWDKAAIGVHMYWYYSEPLVRDLMANYAVINTEIGGMSEAEYMPLLEKCEGLELSWIVLDGFSENRISLASVFWGDDPYFQ